VVISNTSFQLQHFIYPRLLKDEEGSNDEKSFEAVTPEQNVEAEDEKGTAEIPNEKHWHILEDVDGELEMEDVAHPCGVEVSSSCHVSGSETASDGHYKHKQHQSLHCAPPLPEDLPPSPPPLPSSPPHMALTCPAALSLVLQQHLGLSHANTDVTKFHLSSTHVSILHPLVSLRVWCWCAVPVCLLILFYHLCRIIQTNNHSLL